MVKKINLTLPKHWNACTVEQLELISNVMLEQVKKQDRYHPFSMQNVKIALFFALSGIEIVEGPNPRVPVEEQYYTCRMTDHHSWWYSHCSRFFSHLRFFSHCSRRFNVGHQDDTFSLYLWQINYWLSPQTNVQAKGKNSIEAMTAGAGVLDWLDNDNGDMLTRFPYEFVRRRERGKWYTFKQTFRGPERDLNGFSWAQYRLATDAMSSYTELSNALVQMKQMRKFSPEQMAKQEQSVDMAKSMFLATIFIAKTNYVDTNTQVIKHDYHYESNQITDNAEYFRNFPDDKWQVILFWWTGILHTLSKRYPHLFKVKKIDKNKKPDSPLSIYTATIATMQKYAGLTEDQVNNESYSLVLEQLERLTKENEEIERMRHKK